MLTKAILIGVWAGICGIDKHNPQIGLYRPLVSGLVIGLILGDVKTGLITGGSLELVWMGLVTVGGAQIPDEVVAGIIGPAFAILLGQEPGTAVSAAVPFAIAGQGALTLIFTIYAPLMHKFDTFAQEGNTKGINLLAVSQIPLMFLFYGTILFLPVYFGVDAAKVAVESIPTWIFDGLEVAGGMMPAIGFAILLSIMLKKQYWPFLLTGFVLISYFDITIVGITILAVAIALYDFFTKQKKNNDKEGTPDGI